MKKLDQVRDQAQRELWDVVNLMSLRRQTTSQDLRSWASTLDHVRMKLNEAARDAEHTEES